MLQRPGLNHRLEACGHAYRDDEFVRLEFDDDPDDVFLISVKDLSRCLSSFADHAPVVRVFESLIIIAGIARLSTTGHGVCVYLHHYRPRKFTLRRRELADVARGTLPETEIAEDVEYRRGAA